MAVAGVINQTLSSQKDLDAHQTAPDELKAFFKKYTSSDPIQRDDVLDVTNLVLPGLQSIPSEQRDKAFASFDGPSTDAYCVAGSAKSRVRKEAFELDHVSLDIDMRASGGAYALNEIPGTTTVAISLFPRSLTLTRFDIPPSVIASNYSGGALGPATA